jgi:hypothetical protein
MGGFEVFGPYLAVLYLAVGTNKLILFLKVPNRQVGRLRSSGDVQII